ncbi:hypothetical protein CLOM_g11487 [Closterium sp. NIES-68]|nr:hypothetical protein CLOM_g15035 [Closterium sp. NIES-68]GJP34444.1 hypothetical protein CLOM_g18887 [Closterium sp. NIES-68]GJP43985.1 hypothetical protein CLOM_g3381 [Closterium sp. NIES-68]GJP47978.1 hypothetical protein CLOM_g7222 [Closterium sp. NIES-68]GJP51944.1 hypothetical protein CLOM_g11075 [Closterium sp. NIES-68]
MFLLVSRLQAFRLTTHSGQHSRRRIRRGCTRQGAPRPIESEFWKAYSEADQTWLYAPGSCSSQSAIEHEFWRAFSEEDQLWLCTPLNEPSAADSSLEHAFWEEEQTWLYVPGIPFCEPVVTVLSAASNVACSTPTLDSSSSSSIMSTTESGSSSSSSGSSGSSSPNGASSGMSTKEKRWRQAVAYRVGRFHEEEEQCHRRSSRASLGFSPLRPKSMTGVSRTASKKPRPREVMGGSGGGKPKAGKTAPVTPAAAKAVPAKTVPASVKAIPATIAPARPAAVKPAGAAVKLACAAVRPAGASKGAAVKGSSGQGIEGGEKPWNRHSFSCQIFETDAHHQIFEVLIPFSGPYSRTPMSNSHFRIPISKSQC